MALRKAFLWFGGGFLLLLLVVGGWLWTADLGVFKPQLEQWVSDNTGRQFSIDGDFEVHVGEQTVVIAKGVRYANTAWANEPFMLEVGFFELRIDTWSLLKGPVQIELIKLADTSVYLQRSDTDGANWELPPRQADVSEPGPSDEAGRGFRVRQLDVARTKIVYVSPERLGPIELRMEQLHQQHDADDFLNLRLQGGIGDREISLHAKVGAWDALLARKAVQYEVEAQLDTFHFESQGFIDDLTRPSRPSLSINASGPDVNDLARLLRIEPEYDGDIDFSGSLSAQNNEPLRLAVEGRLGKTQVRATGAFSNLQSLEQADLELAVSGPDLSRVARLFGVRRLQPAPFELELDATRDGSDLVINKGHMVFAEAEFVLAAHLPKFPELDDASFHFEIVGARYERFREVIGIPGAAEGPYSLAFDLRQSPNGVEVLQFDLESTLARGRAEGKLGVAPDYFGTDLTFELDIDSLANIGDAYSMAGVPDRPLKIKGTAVLGADGIRTRGPISIRSSDVMAEIDGLIGLARGIAGSDLTVSLNGPNLGELVNLFASTEAVPSLPYSLQGAVQIGADSYRLQKINAKVGRSSIDVDGSIRLGRGLAGTQLNIKSAGPALEELLAGSGGPTLPPGPYTLSGKVALTQDAVRLEGLDVERERGRLSGDLELALPLSKRQASFRMSGHGNDLRAVLGTVYDFEMRQAPFSIDLEGDILSTSLSLEKLDIRIADAAVTASGTLDLGTARRSTRFSLGIDVPNIAELGLFKGRRLRGQSFSLDAQVKGGGGLLTIDELTARLGDSDIQGSGQLQVGATPQLTLMISSDSIRLSPLMEDVELQYEPVPTFDDGRMIPDVAMPFERMASLNAVVKIDIGELQRDDARITNFKLDSQLQDGAFYLRQFGFESPAGWLQAEGSLEPADGAGKAMFKLAARDFSMTMGGLNTDHAARGDLDVNLESTGANARDLAGNLNGVFFVDFGGLTLESNRFVQRLYGDMLGEIISVINPFAKRDSKVNLECVVVPLEITNGNMVTRPSVMVRSDKITIVSNSSIDLGSEKIDLQFQTSPRKGITISAGEVFNPYVKVIGTLASPRLAVDQQGMLISGGAAVATGGLSILARAAWQRLSKSRDPCKTAEERALEAIGDRFSELSPPRSNK